MSILHLVRVHHGNTHLNLFAVWYHTHLSVLGHYRLIAWLDTYLHRHGHSWHAWLHRQWMMRQARLNHHRLVLYELQGIIWISKQGNWDLLLTFTCEIIPGFVPDLDLQMIVYFEAHPVFIAAR